MEPAILPVKYGMAAVWQKKSVQPYSISLWAVRKVKELLYSKQLLTSLNSKKMI